MDRGRYRRLLRNALVISLAVHFVFASTVRINAVEAGPPEKTLPLRLIKIIPPKPTPPPKTHQRPVVRRHATAPVRPVIHPPALSHPSAHGRVAIVPPEPTGNPQPDTGGQTTGGPGTGGTSEPIGTPKPSCDTLNVEAKTIDAVSPDVPEELRAEGVSGTSQIRVDLDAAGNVRSVSVYASSGSAQLDRLALEAAKVSRYVPEKRDCRDVPGSYLFKVDFTQ